MPDQENPCLKPQLKAFPSEFPIDAAKAVGNAILTKSFSVDLIEPIYDLIGFGLGMVFGGSAPFPKPTVSGISASEEAVGQMLVDSSEHLVGDSEPMQSKGALPWNIILPILFQIITKLLSGEKPAES